MANEPESTEYRARPLPETGRLQEVQPEQRVVVTAKNWKSSLTLIVNGSFLAVAIIIQILDIVFGANVIEPIVKVFTTDPEAITRVLTVFTQIYTVANILLRFKTVAPITLNTTPKE